MKKHIAKLRNGRKSWWKQLDAQAVQDVLERIDNAYKKFFSWAKGRSGRKHSPPQFQKSRNYKSFTLKQNGWKLLEGNRVRLLGRTFKFVKSREVTGTIKTVTIKRDNLDRLWICFSVVEERAVSHSTSSNIAAGFDFGLKTFLTADDGTTIKSPQFFKAGAERVAKANRELASKKKGSNNRKKARRILAKTHAKIRNQRRDWHFKTAHQVSGMARNLFFEDLNIDGMSRLWGRKISDLGFGEFLSTLKHIAPQHGSTVRQVGRYFPSSKKCSSCGHIKKDLHLSDRVYTCDSCGIEIDRDLNAAINIKVEGMSSIELADVRPEETLADCA